MPLTPEHNIYYPDSQSQFTPLESHFAALATSVDDAMIAQGVDLLAEAIRRAVPTGTISAFGGTSAPEGYLLCNGASHSTSEYADLYSVIGVRYGGSGGSFNVPDMRGRVGVGYDSGQTEFNALGKTGGAATHTLTEAEMPSHDHGGGTGSSEISDAGFAAGAGSGTASPARIYRGSDSSGRFSATILYSSHQHTIPSSGGGQAHNNLQPYNTVNYIIRT